VVRWRPASRRSASRRCPSAGRRPAGVGGIRGRLGPVAAGRVGGREGEDGGDEGGEEEKRAHCKELRCVLKSSSEGIVDRLGGRWSFEVML
jgi:hypothetical protein